MSGELRFVDRYLRLHVGDVRVVVRSALPELNPGFRAAFAAELEPYRFAIEAGALTDETSRRILARLTAEWLIVAWEPEPPADPAAYLVADDELLEAVVRYAADERYFSTEGVPADGDAADLCPADEAEGSTGGWCG